MKNQSIQTSKDVVQLERISFSRGSKKILKDVNWTIRSGEHWSLIGLNGSGKSTILNLLSGYHFPSSGKIWVLGEEFGKTSIPELRKRIGLVSNWLDRQLPKHFNVLDTVISGKFASFGIYQEVTQNDREEAASLLKEFGFESYRERKIHSLSQGEMQKVLILRALMTQPELLILDEPTNSLDLFAKENFLNFIHKLADRKKELSILFVTHHIEEITDLFTETLLLKNGSIFDKGRTKDILTAENLQKFYGQPIQIKPYTGNRIQIIPQ